MADKTKVTAARDPRALYAAAADGPVRISKAEFAALVAPEGGLEEWERADARNLLRTGDLLYHDEER